MLENGILGTSAPFYMDMITIYFSLLPLLMGIAIFLAIKRKVEAHYRMQLSIFIVSLIFVVIFEIGVRVSGGFNSFMDESNADYFWMSTFLIVHIIIAILSVILWAKLIYSATKEYRVKKRVKSHKKLGQLVYVGMSITAIMGVSIYYFLFVYTKI